MQYLFSLIFPLISYLLQTYPRFFNKYFGVDVWTRLLEVRIIRKNHFRIPARPIKKGFIFEGYFDYPPVFILLLSLLGTKNLEKYQGLIAPFFDALLNIFVFFVAIQLTGNLYIALISQLIYTLTPIVAIENSSLVPRSIGYLLFSISFLIMPNFFAFLRTLKTNFFLPALLISLIDFCISLKLWMEVTAIT